MSSRKTSVSTEPGRIHNYLTQTENKLLPYSCKLHTYKGDVTELLIKCSKDLRFGAGVKLVLDDYKTELPTPKTVNWKFYLTETHPDYNKITDHQKQFLVSDSEIDDLPSYLYLSVADTMDDPLFDDEGVDDVNIERSWAYFYESIVDGTTVVVDLSPLRPYGTTNESGLTATGAVGDGTPISNTSSFLAIYEWLAIYAQDPTISNFIRLFGVLNSTIRRGGIYKNGIITSSMWYENPNIAEYLQCPLVSIPGSHKKGISFDLGILEQDELVDLVLEKVRDESLFLEKKDRNSAFHWNVCVGLGVPDNGTCLIWRENLGAARTNQDIINGYVDTAEKLTKLHISWRDDNPDKAGYSAPLELDSQIGLDVMGLANLLRIRGISYSEFIKGLKEFNSGVPCLYDEVFELISTLFLGMHNAIAVSDQIIRDAGLKPLDRIFCVEPAQAHSYETVDIDGFTTCRGIWPPVGKKVKRRSDTVGMKVYNHGQVETLADLTEDEYETLNEEFQKLLDSTGRAHAISYDLRREPTKEWFTRFVHSPLKTKYYTEIQSTDQSYLQKKAGLAR
jgi:hypothetical protein